MKIRRKLWKGKIIKRKKMINTAGIIADLETSLLHSWLIHSLALNLSSLFALTIYKTCHIRNGCSIYRRGSVCFACSQRRASNFVLKNTWCISLEDITKLFFVNYSSSSNHLFRLDKLKILCCVLFFRSWVFRFYNNILTHISFA